jgi:hypothetical protein
MYVKTKMLGAWQVNKKGRGNQQIYASIVMWINLRPVLFTGIKLKNKIFEENRF